MIQAAVYTLLFYLFGGATIALALVTVLNRRMLRAVMGLMGVLAMSACFYIMLSAEFLAGVQILVYVGGIVVLMVFAIMLTQTVDVLVEVPHWSRRALAGAAALALLLAVAGLGAGVPLEAPAGAGIPEDNTVAIGKALMDYGPRGYVLPFEIISLLLLAAAIGGIVVARKTAPEDQPLTSGGDLADEGLLQTAHTQRDEEAWVPES
ncbi:MAG: NADH-quinone oxidoreductase subunit J [Candidatus Hydrogenedentes bacterium]|nr:NADH-quinone oxidoreductase subunit J [Candidatus Hydrogenedentota bacterium]